MLLVRNPKTGRLFLNVIVTHTTKFEGVEGGDRPSVKVTGIKIVPENIIEDCVISFDQVADQQRFLQTLKAVIAEGLK